MKEKLDLRLFGITATEIYKRKINKHLCDIDPKLNKGNNNDFDGQKKMKQNLTIAKKYGNYDDDNQGNLFAYKGQNKYEISVKLIHFSEDFQINENKS